MAGDQTQNCVSIAGSRGAPAQTASFISPLYARSMEGFFDPTIMYTYTSDGFITYRYNRLGVWGDACFSGIRACR